VHVAWVLFLSFLVFRWHTLSPPHHVVGLVTRTVVGCRAVYLIQGGDDFTDRNTSPNSWDISSASP